MQTIEEITLGSIDEADRTFCLSFSGSLADLERSISAVGQTSPLQVRLRDDERYQLIAGFRRVQVLRQLGRTRVVARVHTLKELPDDKASRLAVFDNLGVREYNLVEKAKAVELLITVGRMSEAEVVQNVLHPLGLQPHGQALDRLRRLLVLEEEQLETIAEEGWPARAVLPICGWRADARRVFFEIVEALRPGANKLTELATWLEEIGLRDDRPLTSIMVDLRLRTMSQDASLEPPERLKVVREAVRRARFPALFRLSRRASELIAQLKLEPYIAVTPPDGFEGDGFEARFSFSSPEELRRIAGLLDKAADHPAAEELRSLLAEGLTEEEEESQP